MPAFADSAPIEGSEQPEQEGNERPLAGLIRDLKSETEAALVARDEFAASEAHEALIDAEHTQRLVETVRRYRK